VRVSESVGGFRGLAPTALQAPPPKSGRIARFASRFAERTAPAGRDLHAPPAGDPAPLHALPPAWTLRDPSREQSKTRPARSTCHRLHAPPPGTGMFRLPP